MSASRPASMWMGLGAVVVLIVGLGLAVFQWRRPPERTMSRGAVLPSVPPDTVSDRVIDRALGPKEGDDKSRWVDEIPGIDVADLDAPRRAVFLRHANTRRCDCDCRYTLAACRVYDASCEESEPEVIALLDSIRSGAITDARGLREAPQ